MIRVFRVWFGRNLVPEAELVFYMNAYVAIGIGVASWLKFDLSLPWALACLMGSFVLMMFSSLHRYTAWIAAGLGSLVSGLFGALLGAAIGLRVGADVGAWIGGVV